MKNKLYILIYEILQGLQKILPVFDPEVRIMVGKKKLSMHLSHRLPIYYAKFPKYDRVLPRVCSELKNIDGRLCLIDIGANIGDTVSLVTDTVDGTFLCIEADSKYFPLLQKNIKNIDPINHVTIERTYCGQDLGPDISIVRNSGTSKIIDADSSKKGISKFASDISLKSLDKIIEDNPSFRNSNLLKIDTDGFEISVLKSAKDFVVQAKPLLYFEYAPKLYINNDQDPHEMWDILKSYGYRDLLFYDNFGNVVKMVDIDDDARLSQLVQNINEKNIYYYDVLACHVERFEHIKILKNELL